MVRFVRSGTVLALGALALGCATQTPTVAGPTTREGPPGSEAPSRSACNPEGEAYYVWKETSEEEADAFSLLTLREGGHWQFETGDPTRSESGCLSETVQSNIERAIASSTLETTTGEPGCTGQPYATIELTVRGIRLVWADECSGTQPHESVPPLITTVRKELGLK